MTSADNKMLTMMAQKMGLEDNTQLLNKANELFRFLKLKSLGGNNIALSDPAQSVICLDLATTSIGIGFDAEHALKLSGLKRNTYLNGLRTIEKLLDLSKDLTVNEICVQLGVTSVAEKAGILLDKYKKSHDCDITHPQYVTMAVYQACRLNKIKLQRNMIVQFSRLKSTQWNVLEKTWTTWVDKASTTLFETEKKHKETEISDHVIGSQMAITSTNIDNDNVEIEDYEIWKKRILEEAYKELQLKNKK